MRLQRGLFVLDVREKSLNLREKLDGRLLVGDGAMGTPLADRGAYLMPPASMPHLAGDVIEPVVIEPIV